MGHSQNGETELVLQYFNGRTGHLLDVGAYDGISLSNSFDLIQAGWSGALLEPDPRSFEAMAILYRDHPRVRVYNFGIALQSGEQPFHINGMLSTIHPQTFREGEQYESRTAMFKTWDEFYRGEQYQFISIDAEGADWDILQQMDLKAMGTECLCAEHNGDGHLRDRITGHCEDAGLRFIHSNFENIIFAL